MSLTDALQQLSDGEDLSSETMDAAMSQIMQGEADPAQIGGLLMGLAVLWLARVLPLRMKLRSLRKKLSSSEMPAADSDSTVPKLSEG